jgi:hypothetical protein
LQSLPVFQKWLAALDQMNFRAAASGVIEILANNESDGLKSVAVVCDPPPPKWAS